MVSNTLTDKDNPWRNKSMEFLKALKGIVNKQHRKTGTRSYYDNGEVYFSRLFGYKRVGDRYEPDPRYKDHIRTIFEMLAGGSSLPAIKTTLDSQGARDSSNNRYAISRIIAIAERPIYAGCLLQRGRFVRINNITPLITLEMWRKAAKQLKWENKKLVE
jgi:hypothetical protein